MSPLMKLIGTLAAASVCIALAGFLLAAAWYHDDACSIEDWKCDLGGIGFNLAIYAGVPAALFLVVLGVSAVVSVFRR